MHSNKKQWIKEIVINKQMKNETPFSDLTFASTSAARRARMTSAHPFIAARWRGVWKSELAIEASAPFFKSKLTDVLCLFAAAQWRGVQLWVKKEYIYYGKLNGISVVFALISIFPIKKVIHVKLPYAAAKCNNVIFFLHLPQSGNSSTIGGSPVIHLRNSSKFEEITNLIISSIEVFCIFWFHYPLWLL